MRRCAHTCPRRVYMRCGKRQLRCPECVREQTARRFAKHRAKLARVSRLRREERQRIEEARVDRLIRLITYEESQDEEMQVHLALHPQERTR